MNHKAVGVTAAIVVGLLFTTGSAVASPAPQQDAARTAAAAPAPNSITGAMIKDGTIYGADIAPAVVDWFTGTYDNTVTTSSVKDGALQPQDFSPAAKTALKGDTGNPGPAGAVGPTGPAGPAGPAATWSGKHWGTVLRNTIGSGSADLKATSTTAPVGDGALEINTASATDKASFGNEVDFTGDLVSAINHVGYSVYTTGENNAIAAGNMPSLTFEINPHITGSARTYSSMVFTPGNTAANTWTAVDATDDSLGKVWGLTGADMPCNINGSRCTWSELQTALNDGGDPATVLTLAVGKGRDHEFHGAIDKLVYNATTFDFEPTGVKH